VNDPNQIIDQLDLNQLSLEAVENQIKSSMEKLNFQLPPKLILPIALFYVSNTIATKFQIHKEFLEVEYNPSGIGIVSPKVLELLNDVKHPSIDPEGD